MEIHGAIKTRRLIKRIFQKISTFMFEVTLQTLEKLLKHQIIGV